MEVSKNRQKYKHYTCLCFSVMGQRRFRVSMGVLIASPEAGDASVNVVSEMKKHSAISADSSKNFIPAISEGHNNNQSAFMIASNYNSINNMDKDACKHTVLMENSTFDKMSSSTVHDSCQFPYYSSPDAVLVKDVGVSCMLLNQDIPEIPIPETRNLVKYLKKEYYDLSNITSKITAYTKDILNHLSKKNQRQHQLSKDLVASKHAISSQYVDNKGNLCLKLRLYSNAETQYNAQHVNNFDNILCTDKYVPKQQLSKHFKKPFLEEDNPIIYNNKKLKYEKDIQTAIRQENAETSTSNSISPRTSSIYNHLMMKKKKTSSGSLNPKIKKFSDMHKYGHSKRFSDNKGCKDQLKKRNPIIFTNWKEISKSKQSENKTLSIFSNESQLTANTKNENVQEFINYNTINNISNTKFHTVNIRIIKQSKKNV